MRPRPVGERSTTTTPALSLTWAAPNRETRLHKTRAAAEGSRLVRYAEKITAGRPACQIAGRAAANPGFIGRTGEGRPSGGAGILPARLIGLSCGQDARAPRRVATVAARPVSRPVWKCPRRPARIAT